ncbi:GNAT family N-acetyltransferase [Elioraea rosea]|uniref:GNAT family N-acetyltransferase n=1 Tax=Elioraea rosea TaxID=2492390 RepID=UPI001184C97F|nr:GNAT family N-acetyltransferase [Elioraea rosea]
MAAIRDLTDDDRAAVAALWRGLFDEHAGREHEAAGWRSDVACLDAAIARWLGRILDGVEGFALVAEAGTGIAGFIACFERDQPWLHPARRGVIGALAVEPAWRRQGLGTALLRTAEARFAGAGVEIVEASIAARNGVARRFWKRATYGDTSHTVARIIISRG